MNPCLRVIYKFIGSKKAKSLVDLDLLLEKPLFSSRIEASCYILLRLPIVIVFRSVYLIFFQNQIEIFVV